MALSQFLVHVELPQLKGDVLLGMDQTWFLVYQGQQRSGGWDLGKVGSWEWDTSRDYCLLYDNRAGNVTSSPGGSVPNGLAEYIVLGLKGFNADAASFGMQGVSAWGADRAFDQAPRGSWEIIAKPGQMNEVREELRKLHEEIEASYRQIALDVIGCVDPTPISDLTSAVMSAQRRDYIGVTLSLISVLPYIGDLAAKSAKFARMAERVAQMYQRLKRVMHTLQMLEERAVQARRALAESMERARAVRARALQQAAAAETRMRRAFEHHAGQIYSSVARQAGWLPADLAAACRWCKFTEPPKLVIARRRSEIALQFEGKAGYVPKPMSVKLKTAKSGPNRGLVVKPSEAELADVARREGAKSAEKMRENIVELEKQGFHFRDDGLLIDPRGRKVFSDVDFMGIYNVPVGRDAKAWGGRLVENDDPFYADWINNLFFSGRKNKQHGNQDRFAKKLESEAQDFGHVPGRMPDADELVEKGAFLVIGPDGIPRNCSYAELSAIYRQYGIPNPYHGHI